MKRTRHQAFAVRFTAASLVVAFCVVGAGSIAFAQTSPPPRKLANPVGASPVGAKPSGGKAAPTVAAPGSAPTPAATAPAGETESAGAASVDAGGSVLDRAVAFLIAHAITIVISLGAVAAIAMGWLALRKKDTSAEDEALAKPLIPKTRASAAPRPPSAHGTKDDEGPRRVLVTPGATKSQGAIKVADVEREYALVVDEKDLAKPPVPEDVAARKAIDAKPLGELLSKESFDLAYQWWEKELDGDRRMASEPAIELRLSDHFLARGDLEKAKRVLEHHVSTQPTQAVKTEAYFNLAYLHFKGKTLTKSRRYFQLFCERHDDPAQVERARKILGRLEKVHNLN